MPSEGRVCRKRILTHFGDDLRSCTRIVETQLPPPSAQQVLIRNIYAGVNGIYDLAMSRNAIDYLTIALPADMGIETVGVVEEVGRDVQTLRVGDVVASWHVGRGYRDHHVTEVRSVFKVPEISPAYLGLFPTGLSGMVGIEQVGELARGETVLVTAAAGGMGHVVVQVAKNAGNHVIGVCSSDHKCSIVADLGCDRVINYRSEDLGAILKTEYPQGLDIIYDMVGGELYDVLLDHLAVRGRMVISGMAAETALGPIPVQQPRPGHKLYFKSASIRGFVYPHFKDVEADAVRRLLEAHQSGKIKVLLDPTSFKGLESVPDAVDYLLTGQNIGKVVVEL